MAPRIEALELIFGYPWAGQKWFAWDVAIIVT
jgi:hypothetical protein